MRPSSGRPSARPSSLAGESLSDAAGFAFGTGAPAPVRPSDLEPPMATGTLDSVTPVDDAPPVAADVFVIFGITGDLARVMTFLSLYRLELRGLLDCPVVGVAVDDWTLERLVTRARDSIVATGEELDQGVFERFADRLSYVRGGFGDPNTYRKVAEAIPGARRPVFYLEIPPFLFGTVVKGLSEVGLCTAARIVVEKPFGHDTATARALADELHQYV